MFSLIALILFFSLPLYPSHLGVVDLFNFVFYFRAFREKMDSINDRYDKVRGQAAQRRTRLNEANTLHQFFRDVDDEESWIKEKKLLVSSDDYGRDLTGRNYYVL